MTNLADRLDSEPENWTHGAGDKLLGLVVDTGTFSGEYGDSKTFTILVEEEGSTENEGRPVPVGAERIFYASRTVARSKIEELRPAIGDRLGVKYLGIPEGKEYHSYRFVHERAAGNVAPAEPESTAEPEFSGEELPPAPDDDIPF